MSDQQKKTPREIAAEMMGDYVGLKYYGLISNFHERDQGLIRKIEQAIEVERKRPGLLDLLVRPNRKKRK